VGAQQVLIWSKPETGADLEQDEQVLIWSKP
jgi:hypothetical protein